MGGVDADPTLNASGFLLESVGAEVSERMYQRANTSILMVKCVNAQKALILGIIYI